MFTHITQSLQKNRKRKILFIAFCFSLLSLYPIYKNFYNGAAVTTYERHINLIKGKSEYYNPWQYRILCPVLIEGMMWVYNHTIDKIYPVEEKFHFQFEQTSEPTPETKKFIELVQTKGALKYMIVFLLFRFGLNFTVFLFAFALWRYFIRNHWLVFAGLMFVSLAMGNAVVASDLTFNTYLDNVFYLLAACIIVYRKNQLWLIPLTVAAAFNRETALLIPFLFFISHINFTTSGSGSFSIASIRLPERRVWMITGICYILFAAIFSGIRLYYGYVPAQVWKVPPGIPMIKLNLFSTVAAKSYFEMLGVFSVIPFIILYKLRTAPLLLRIWFILIVPVWFAVHIYSVVIYQTRLFLVPVIMIMIPMLLYIIENWYNETKASETTQQPIR
jgi:hypothetical protein